MEASSTYRVRLFHCKAAKTKKNINNGEISASTPDLKNGKQARFHSHNAIIKMTHLCVGRINLETVTSGILKLLRHPDLARMGGLNQRGWKYRLRRVNI